MALAATFSSVAACGGSRPSAATSEPSASALALQPPAADAAPGDAVQFLANPPLASPAGDTLWSVVESDGGRVDAAGRYTAPLTEGTFTLLATRLSTGVRASAQIRVLRHSAQVTVAVSPSSVSLAAGASKTFTAVVGNTSNTAVTWSVQEGAAGGTITSTGVYTAPGAAGTFHVVATSVADPTRLAIASVVVAAPAPPPTVAVAVTPASISASAGQSATFSAAVTGTSNTAVSWAVQEGASGGSITSAGVYTAPSAAGTFHVVATSAADPTKSSAATVTVASPAPPPPPPPTTSGPQLYVSTSGNDANPGTLAAPWRTIQKAMNTATAGSTVNILAGTYFERLAMNVSGNATGGFITFQNYGYSATPGTPATVSGDQVVIDGTGANPAGDTLLSIANQSYVRVQGLQFANLTMAFNGRAIQLAGTGSHIEILNNKIHDIVANGDYTAQSSIYPFLAMSAGLSQLLISGNEIYNCKTGYSEAMTIAAATQWVIANNYFHDLDAIVIDVGSEGSGPAANHGTVRGNRIERLGPYSNYGLMANENTTIKVGQGIYVQGGQSIVVERNQVSNANYGINVTAEAGYQPNDTIYVRDNDVSGISNLSGAITVGEWAGEANTTSNVQITNNTLHDNPFGLEILTATGVVAKNNLFTGNTTNVYNAYGAAMTLDYNLYSGGETPAQDGHPVVASPGFTTGIQIGSSSPAWNAGDPSFVAGPSYDGVAETDLNGKPRVAYSRVDLGAVEVQ